MTRKITEKEKIALLEFKQKVLRKFGKNVLELKLFGSKARGESRQESDIDVLIILKSLSKEKEDFIINLTVQLFFKYGTDISVKIFSLKEFLYLTNLQTPFMSNIKKEAVSL